MKNILITGGAGFIGSNFIHHLLSLRENVNVINLDALTYAGNLQNLNSISKKKNYKFINGDICNQLLVKKIFSKYEIDTVIHFAAETHVDRSIHDPLKFMHTNVLGTHTLLNESVEYWQKEKLLNSGRRIFHHISTDEVYGSLNPGDPAFSEKTAYAPNSPYAASKAASDHIIRAYFHTFHLPILITNCSNNYGPFQFPEKLIPLIIQNAMDGKPLPIYGDGQQIRDWLYVEDHCEAILSVLERGKVGETYNIGGNNQSSNIEIVRTICNILDNELPDSPYKPHASLIRFVEDRPGHDRRYAMDITKIKKQLGWQPRESLSTGLSKTVKWYLNNQAWTQSIISCKDYQRWMKSNYAKREEVQK